jgi:hypothetical protein
MKMLSNTFSSIHKHLAATHEDDVYPRFLVSTYMKPICIQNHILNFGLVWHEQFAANWTSLELFVQGVPDSQPLSSSSRRKTFRPTQSCKTPRWLRQDLPAGLKWLESKLLPIQRHEQNF